jgi:hypothetical protein
MIRFMADADLNGSIVGGCRRREPAIDFLSAHDANLEGVSDPDVPALAAEEDRILVSHDFQTMPRHFGDFLQARGSSPGLILVPPTHAHRRSDRGTLADLGCVRCGGVEESVAGAAPAVSCALRHAAHEQNESP